MSCAECQVRSGREIKGRVGDFVLGKTFQLTITAYRATVGPYSMLPKCPHCQEPLTKKQVARLLASLSAGKPKNYTDEERTLRRERMRAINARRSGSGSSTAMQHRHLTHQDFTLAAIDDVIARGRRDAWESLQAAFGRDREIRAKVLRVCAAHVADPYAQRYHFWNNYAHLQAAS